MEYHDYRTALCRRNRIETETTVDDDEESFGDVHHDHFADDYDDNGS